MTESNFSRQIRRSCEFALSTTDLPGIAAGKRIATPVCALVRNDMLKTGRCQRLQGRLARGVCRRRWHVSGCKDAFRQYTGSAPLQPLTRIFLQHVIARSEATWQSVTPAVAQSKEQHLRQTRKSVYEFARSSASLPSFPAGTRIATPVCALVRNDMLKTEAWVRLQERGTQ